MSTMNKDLVQSINSSLNRSKEIVLTSTNQESLDIVKSQNVLLVTLLEKANTEINKLLDRNQQLEKQLEKCKCTKLTLNEKLSDLETFYSEFNEKNKYNFTYRENSFDLMIACNQHSSKSIQRNFDHEATLISKINQFCNEIETTNEPSEWKKSFQKFEQDKINSTFIWILFLCFIRHNLKYEQICTIVSFLDQTSIIQIIYQKYYTLFHLTEMRQSSGMFRFLSQILFSSVLLFKFSNDVNLDANHLISLLQMYNGKVQCGSRKCFLDGAVVDIRFSVTTDFYIKMTRFDENGNSSPTEVISKSQDCPIQYLEKKPSIHSFPHFLDTKYFKPPKETTKNDKQSIFDSTIINTIQNNYTDNIHENKETDESIRIIDSNSNKRSNPGILRPPPPTLRPRTNKVETAASSLIELKKKP